MGLSDCCAQYFVLVMLAYQINIYKSGFFFFPDLQLLCKSPGMKNM